MRVSHLAAMATLIALLGAMFVAMGSASAQASHSIVFNDTDARVTAGKEVQAILVTAEDASAGFVTDNAVSAAWTVELGLLVGNVTGTQTSRATGAAVTGAVFISTKGAPNGEYKVIATVGNQDYETTLTVGDPGDALGSVEVTFGKVGHSGVSTDPADGAVAGQYGATPPTWDSCQDDGQADDDHSPNCIALTVTAKNSLGAMANKDDVTAIHLFAPLATLVVNTDSVNISATDAANDGTVNIGGAQASATFFVTKEAAGTVEVTAIVLGESGSVTSEPVPLTFTGSAATISVSEASGPLARTGTRYMMETDTGCNAQGARVDNGSEKCAEIKAEGVADFEVTATDKSGNAATPPAVAVTVKDADGNQVATISAAAAARPKSGAPLTHIIELAATSAKPGSYTATFMYGTDKHERDVVVSGAAASVSLITEWNEDGNTVTVTATVTDAADGTGNPVPDATDVSFEAVGNLDLRARSGAGVAKDADGKGATVKTNDGVAVVRFSPIASSGTALIFASIPGADAVADVSIEAEPEEAMPEEEASVSCLSELSGFATWSCGVEADASAIFDMVTGRGVSAIHLWNGSTWVRYSVVDDAMVPGSSDFMVTENDILYISN